MATNKLSAKVKNNLSSSLNISYKRYIFFDSLTDSNPSYAQGFKTYIQSNLKPIHVDAEQENKEEAINYMWSYINNLRELAQSEQEQEEKYLQTLKKNNIEIPELITNKGFDITFLKEINLALQDNEQFEKNVQIHKHNLDTIREAIKKYEEDIEQDPNSMIEFTDSNKNVRKADKNVIKNEYILHHMETYRSIVNKILTQTGKSKEIQETIDEKITKYVNSVFDILKADDNFVSELSKILTANNIDLLRKTILNQAMNHINLGIDSLKNNIINSLRQQIKLPSKSQINETWTNILTSSKEEDTKKLKDIINIADKQGIKLADMILSLTAGEKAAFRETINANDKHLSELFKNLEKENHEYINKTQNASKTKLAKAKEKFSKALRASVTQAKQSNRINQQMIQLTDDELLDIIINQYRVSITPDALKEMIEKELQILHIDTADTGELIAAVQADVNQNGIKTFVGGHKIQLKDDLAFTYKVNHTNISKQLKKMSTETKNAYTELDEKIKNASKTFMTRYNTATVNSASGETNTAKAIDTYIQTLKEIYEDESKLLTKINNKTDRKKIKESLEFAMGGVSVKDYKDATYNNEIGFSAGSLGGGGRVISAIPNITKMLEMGGITVIDADAIITALLNSFDDSLIGRQYEEDIKNYLIAGAAMLLFDDGFANAKEFLEKMKDQIKGIKFASKYNGSVHLLYLNGVYIPQSFLLNTIIKNLEQVVQNIELNQINRNQNQTNRLELINPMSKKYLDMAIEEYPSEEQQFERWQYVRGEAEENVTISFFFMAGMLDILEALEKSFNLKAG